MTYLLYFSTCFSSTFLGGILDEAISLSKLSGNRVIFATCDGIYSMCMYNYHGSKPLCKICGAFTHKIIAQYGIECISMRNFEKNKPVSFNYSNAEQLKKIAYRDVNLGLGVISNYITMTRNLSPKIDNKSRVYFDAHLAQGVKLVDAVYDLLDIIKPDFVYTYNPRFEEFRPVFEICKKIGICCKVTEAVKWKGKWNKVIYDNHMPHDIFKRKERREYCWANYPLSEEGKVDLGNSFYKKRRGGQESGDVKIYVANQKEGNAPVFDERKRNIAIMNSSEDEFAAVGGDWEKLKLFRTQYDGIMYLLENANNSFHFYLRVHPNLTDIPYKYHTDLYNLEKRFSNITVIPARSEMSTYTIMEKCEKVICFGSTMGIESSYWGKPAILLGPSYYYYDDVVYVPKSRDELMNMLVAKLDVKKNINIIKYGAYTLDSSPIQLEMKNLDCQVIKRSFVGIKYHGSKYLNCIINEQVTSFIIAVLRKITGAKFFWKYSIPILEE